MKQKRAGKILTTRVTDSEHQQLQAKAKRLGLTVSRLLHDLALSERDWLILPEVNRLTYQKLGEIQQMVQDLEPSELKELIDLKVRELRQELIGLEND